MLPCRRVSHLEQGRPVWEMSFSVSGCISVNFQDDFDVDKFVADCRKRVQLEEMRQDLEHYYRLLKTAMVELINKDYADFVNLSTNLVCLDLVGIPMIPQQSRTHVCGWGQISSECVMLPCDVAWAAVWKDAVAGFACLGGNVLTLTHPTGSCSVMARASKWAGIGKKKKKYTYCLLPQLSSVATMKLIGGKK